MAFAPRIKAWSFTRYSDYALCPRKARYKYIEKLKEPGNEAMDRGKRIHEEAAAFLIGRRARPPKEVGTVVGKVMRELRRMRQVDPLRVLVEDSWALTKAWRRTQFDDWGNCWVRMNVDAAVAEGGLDKENGRLLVYDWKTGKMRPSDCAKYSEQLELYSVAALAMWGNVQEVVPALYFIDADAKYPETPTPITRADFNKLKLKWTRRVSPMLADETFAMQSGRHCSWCHFRRSNGGPCEF